MTLKKNNISSEVDRERINFSKLKQFSKEKNRLEKFDKKIYQRKKLKLRSPLEVREEVLILAAQLQEKDSPVKFYRSSVDNKPCFHKEEIFLIENRKKIAENFFYWLKSSRTEKN